MLFPAITKPISRLMLFGLLVCLTACSNPFTSDFRDPTIHLVKVEVVRAKLLEQKFDLYFRVNNPNDFSLDIDDFSYSIYLNDIQLAKGQSSISFSLPPNSNTDIKVPVRTNLWRNLKQVIRMLKDPNQAISYRLDGQVEVGSWFGRTVHVSRSGEITPGSFIPE